MDVGESMCYGECHELCKTDESQTCPPEADNTLYVNKNKSIKNKEMMESSVCRDTCTIQVLQMKPSEAQLLVQDHRSFVRSQGSVSMSYSHSISTK